MDYAAFHVQHNIPTPLYQQIADQITAAAFQGDIKSGEQLPPIRRLADLLGVSPITVTQAYQALALAGVAGGQIGRGTFILPAPMPSPTGSGVRPAQLADASAGEGVALAPLVKTPDTWELPQAHVRTPRTEGLRQLFAQLMRDKSEESLIDISNGKPEPALFSLAHWQQLMAQAGRSLDQESRLFDQESRRLADLAAFQYGPALGDMTLRAFLADYLQRFSLQVTPDNILLTSGTQQGLDLIARTFFQPGESVFVEQYSYIAALDIFDNYGVHLQPVPLDEDGVQVEAFERLLGAPQLRPRWLFIIPTGQSPTGVSLAVERRRRLVEVAQRNNVLIIEDDAFNELTYEPGQPAPAVASFAPGGVIYLKSFSKTSFPAVRLGCLVTTPELLAPLAEQKGLVDRGTSLVVARTMLAYLRSPTYERNLERLRTVYRQRRDVLLAALERELFALGCHWTRPRAGFSLLLTLPAEFREMEVMEETLTQGVALFPGRFFTPSAAEAREVTLRLTFADRAPEQLEEATRRLALALRTLLAREPRQLREQSVAPARRFTTDV